LQESTTHVTYLVKIYGDKGVKIKIFYYDKTCVRKKVCELRHMYMDNTL